MSKFLLMLILCTSTIFAEGFISFSSPNNRPFGGKMLLDQHKSKQTVQKGGYSQAFVDLAKSYANASVEFEHLKAVTLAMMMLESGRGNSDLATKHYNFGGLKFRPEMSNYASKVRYNASDGIDHYCKFESPESFIAGFWVFLDRRPYVGWRNAAADQKSFIEFIAPIYCPFNPDYTNRVLALVPEAQKLLDSYKDEGFRIALLKN